MKKHTLIALAIALSFSVSAQQADTMFVHKGQFIYEFATAEVDSIIFYRTQERMAPRIDTVFIFDTIFIFDTVIIYDTGYPIDIPFVEIGRGMSSGLSGEDRRKQTKIITTQEEWENLKTAMRNNFNGQKIDFETDMIIAVFDEPRMGTYPWEIAIVALTAHLNKIETTVYQYFYCERPVFWVGSHPYHIVKIPKTNKKIESQYEYHEIPFLNVDETPISATKEASSYFVVVHSCHEWEAFVEDAENHTWCTLPHVSGVSIGFSIRVAENPLYTTRSATVKVTSQGLTRTVVVNQEAAENPNNN